jgi:hypothetical protein
MVVEVTNRLAGDLTGVDDNPETGIRDPLLRSKPGNNRMNPRCQLTIFRREIPQGGDMPSRDDQDVHRGRRVYVPESQNLIVRVKQLTLDLTGGYGAEDTS